MTCRWAPAHSPFAWPIAKPLTAHISLPILRIIGPLDNHVNHGQDSYKYHSQIVFSFIGLPYYHTSYGLPHASGRQASPQSAQGCIPFNAWPTRLLRMPWANPCFAHYWPSCTNARPTRLLRVPWADPCFAHYWPSRTERIDN